MISTLTTNSRYIHFLKETALSERPSEAVEYNVEIQPHELELIPQPFDVLNEQARDEEAARLADVPLKDLELETVKPHIQWAINPETKDAGLIIYRTNVLGPAAQDPSYEVEDDEDF
jgi:hypothetical protein